MSDTVTIETNAFWGWNAQELALAKTQIIEAAKNKLGQLEKTGGGLVVSGVVEGSSVQITMPDGAIEQLRADWMEANNELTGATELTIKDRRQATLR